MKATLPAGGTSRAALRGDDSLPTQLDIRYENSGRPASIYQLSG